SVRERSPTGSGRARRGPGLRRASCGGGPDAPPSDDSSRPIWTEWLRRNGPGPDEASAVGIRPEEHVCLDARRHTVVLARPLSRAVLLAVGGIMLLALPWPLFAA